MVGRCANPPHGFDQQHWSSVMSTTPSLCVRPTTRTSEPGSWRTACETRPEFPLHRFTIGVLCVGSHSNKTFSESKKDVLCLMGNIASLEIARKLAEERLAQSENELRHLSAQLLRAQEDERKRLAQELHDGIGQSISAIKFRVETCVKQIQKNPGLETTRQLQTLLPMVQSTCRRSSADSGRSPPLYN